MVMTTFIDFLDKLMRIAYNHAMFTITDMDDDPTTEITFVAEGHLLRLPAKTDKNSKSLMSKGFGSNGVLAASTGCCYWCGTEMSEVDSRADNFPCYNLNKMACVKCNRTRLDNRCNEYKKRAKKHKTYSKLSKVDMVKVIMKSGGKCQKCGIVCQIGGEVRDKKKRNKLTLDHDYPMVLGGMNIPQNLVVLCEGCHAKKDKWIGVG
jgi:5-methylcytosine-specific restriction endonuclease McrA